MIKKHALLLELESRLSKEIIFLDGAMGTMIQQRRFSEEDYRGERYPNPAIDLKGNNEILVFTQPDCIKEIHTQYLAAGADIIETNTFNANRISQKDFELEADCFEMNRVAAQLALEAAKEFMQKNPDRKVYVVGSIGPTNRTASLSPDVQRPGYRAVSFDQLVEAYDEQIRGLLAGGCEFFLPETAFDTLNLKACLMAIQNIEEENNIKYPLMISVTITDASGRTLSGQTIEAFWNSIRFARPLSVGLNCALGAKEMRPLLAELARISDCFISCYPNAGLPNPLSLTGYDETPDTTAFYLKQFTSEKLVNIVGGCCGTTPAHIQKVVDALKSADPHKPSVIEPRLRLSGLEPLNLNSSGERSFIMIGERTNVTGSPKFSQMIKNGELAKAVEVARQQVENGANIIDINFDEGMLDGVPLMKEFLNLLGSEPDISRVPFMVDSSKWEILEEGLKNIQGKPIINSISLKDGEADFLEKANLARKYGAAVVVMAFDEKGQAATRQEKVDICQRAYRLLTETAQFPAEDIIFDPNVLTVATGIEEHNRYALDFIEAVKEIKKTCPFAMTSGGVSNLSFGFRGQNQVREAMHSVFLYHAIKSGLDMGIVNAGMLDVYQDLDKELRDKSEAVILCQHENASDELITFAEGLKSQKTSGRAVKTLDWRGLPLQERITHSLVHGLDQFVELDAQAALDEVSSPLKVIEGHLMNGMKVVGGLFGEGKMFLPQVVKSARVMKKAVAYLEPMMLKEKQAKSLGATSSQGKVVMATVKGDVHDIGKNIVGVVLACNGYEVIDLGVMVSCAQIIKSAIEHKADLIGLSGLITPSLEEMAFNLKEFETAGIGIPVLIGGATTSRVHTAVKLDPNYKLPVVYVTDASQVVEACQLVLHAKDKNQSWEQLKTDSERIRTSYLESQAKRTPNMPLEQAQSIRFKTNWSTVDIAVPKTLGAQELKPKWEDLTKLIDWSPFFWTWELKGLYPGVLKHPKYGAQATELFQEAQATLKKIGQEGWCQPMAMTGIFPAFSEADKVWIFNPEILKTTKLPAKNLVPQALAEFDFPRQRNISVINSNISYGLTDFIAPWSSGRWDYMGTFAVTAGQEIEDRANNFKTKGDDYTSILWKALSDRLAEATAEWAHLETRKNFGFGLIENLTSEDLIAEKYRGIRPAPGYPACPNHIDKKTIWNLLPIQEKLGISLTENLAMSPASSVSGFYFNHPESKYFNVGPQD